MMRLLWSMIIAARLLVRAWEIRLKEECGLVDDEKEEEEEEEGAGQCGVEELSIFLQGFLRLRLCSFSLNSSTPRHSGDMSLSKTLMQLVSGVLRASNPVRHNVVMGVVSQGSHICRNESSHKPELWMNSECRRRRAFHPPH